jgi:HEAT repeat protein
MGWFSLFWITSEVKMKSFLLSAWTLILVAGSLNPSFSQTPEGLLETPSPLSTWFAAQAGTGAGRPGGVAAGRPEDEEAQMYERGTQALDQRRWDRAQSLFDDVVKLKGRRVDGALYWKAYAQNKQGQRAEALATLAALRSGHPQSRWLKEAAALEVEVRQASGQSVSPEGTGDEELKLIAINSLLHTDSERALPMLEKFLQGSQPPKLKERALFVLSQSNSPRGREIVAGIARGNANPELQMQALKYLGVFGGKESRQVLADIYGSSASVDVKKAILRSFMVAGEKERVLAAAKGESVPELRREAIRQLGVMGAQPEIWQLYQSETVIENKKELLRAMFISGNAEKLLELARTEKDASLRKSAIRNLGTMGESKSGEALVAMYASEKELDIRKEIIQALFLQQNAKALVDIARKETDPDLKKAAAQKLSLMNSKEGTEYFMDLLK